jgi:4'-phosphopantetheinyl transferase EntD
MGIVIDQKVNNDCRLGVWEIEETYDELLSQLNLPEADLEKVQNFKSKTRKLEWLSVRVLLKKLHKRDMHIKYNESRKPFLTDNSFNISISHSEQYTSVLLCKGNHSVGIDIEKMKPKIENIAPKFLKDEEISNIYENQKIYHLYLHWCAKESLYKLFDKKNIRFKDNITIEPFIPQDRGTIFGKVNNSEIQTRVQLNYFHLENYSFVWCYK